MKFYRHILRAHIGPFTFSFITIMFIFLLQYVMKYIDQFVGKGLSGWVIAELMVLNLAWMVVLAVPMSVLVATLMAFGGMSSTNEITAMKASGMSLYRMMAPVVLAAVLLTYGMIQFNNDVLPEANHMAKTLLIDIRQKKPTLTIVPGLFNDDISGYSILVRKRYEQSNDLEGITIYDYTNPNLNVVITGDRGRVSFTPDYRRLIMDIQNGEIHQVEISNKNTYQRMRFVNHRIVMNVEGFDFERSDEERYGRGDRELSARTMQSFVDSIRHTNSVARNQLNVTASEPFNPSPPPPAIATPIYYQGQRQSSTQRALTQANSILNYINSQVLYFKDNEDHVDAYLVEIYKKYSIPVACLVFVFIGAPLGIMARKGTFGVAATLSIGFFLLYWSCLMWGEKLAKRGMLSPWLGMWIANIILALLGAYLTIRIAQENPYIRWESLRKFIPKILRSSEPDPE
ncbi:MAG: LptF/LptG family permease [Bacteroidota bacterium]